MPFAVDDAPWSKPNQFVVALDIGTTHSSVTYAHLQNNVTPLNDRVTHWPSRVGLGGSSDAKTASMLYYDSENRVKAAGAAVATPTTRHTANRNGWNLVRYFKLQMHPPEMVQDQNFDHIEELPSGLRLEKVYADMISYMLNHTREFFNQRNSVIKWEQLAPTMNLVMAHPNGWGLREQDRLRQAIVLSGVMDDSEARRRVYFVPEAEAAVHYVLWEKSQELQPGDEFIVCDAGGSTVDTTAYRVLAESENKELNLSVPPTRKENRMSRLFRPASSIVLQDNSVNRSSELLAARPAKPAIRLKELKASDCQPAGGVLVNEKFSAWLQGQFFALPPEHPYNLDLCVQKAEESFEANCKREFRSSSDAPSEYIVEMSTAIQELGYPDGNIVIPSDVVRSFFDDAVRLTLESIRKQIAGTKAKLIFLVGGFGASQYLRQCVVNEFHRGGRQVMFLDDAHGKAASDGSIIWFVRQGVTGRAARMSFGLEVVQAYNPDMTSHRMRRQVMLPNGQYHVQGKWDLIVEKDCVIDERFALRRSYARVYSDPNIDFAQFMVELYAWNGSGAKAPEWIKDYEGNIADGFSVICKINADLSGMRGSLKKQTGESGTYYKLQFDLCLEFGGVELKAYLEWSEKKLTRRSDAKIIVMSNPLSSENPVK
ncbi:heat shock protein 70 kDa 12A [Ceratobasidium sp. AG-Ba]|nr:heat shock protein 70 kDa 12A [Ceratobasidium sp. AG-Ba]